MAFPKDMISWETWKRTSAIYLLSIANLLLNVLSVWLLWQIASSMHQTSQAIQQAVQQIAVVSTHGTPAPAIGG